ncbi:glutamate 5-kinase [Amanita muscaria]
MARRPQARPSTIVIKLGTSSIVHEDTHQPLLSVLSSVVETVVRLKGLGHKIVLVSSGAIGVGLKRMNIPSRPKSLSGKQALAAIGQGRLIALWDNLFGQLEQPIAQVLLTRGDISDRTRYLNAVNTFKELLSMGVVPIVNENDTVSVSEIKFGDNDTLSAITASMIHADYLFLLTDVDGLYTANPRKDPNAKQIEAVESVAAIRSQVSTTTLGSSLGTGGMETKLIAAEIATAAGVATIITSSKQPENISKIIEYHNLTVVGGSTDEHRLPQTSDTLDPNMTGARPPHTIFLASPTPMRDLKAWTSHTLHPSGSVIIDAGAHHVLSRRESGGRLLAAGVVGVIGAFASGQAVRVVVKKRKEGDSLSEETDAAALRASYAKASETRPNTPGTPKEPLSRSHSSSTLRDPGTLSKTPQHADNTPLLETAKEEITEASVVEVGRGQANYNSEQISKVKGLNSSYIPQLLGYADSEYVVENITIRVPP